MSMPHSGEVRLVWLHSESYTWTLVQLVIDMPWRRFCVDTMFSTTTSLEPPPTQMPSPVHLLMRRSRTVTRLQLSSWMPWFHSSVLLVRYLWVSRAPSSWPPAVSTSVLPLAYRMYARLTEEVFALRIAAGSICS